MQKNNLLGMSIVALVEAALFVALAIASNSAIFGFMVGVAVPEAVRALAAVKNNENEE